MSFKDFLIALVITFIWGTNFVVIHYGLLFFPPFLFAALRFIFTFLPWCFIFKKPDVKWRYLILSGLFLGVGQFGLLYWAIQGHIAPGIASLLVQSQIFFSILLSFLIFKEKPLTSQFIALSICAFGFILIAISSANMASSNITLFGLILSLLTALSWGCSNMVARKIGKVNMMNFMVWGGLFASIPLCVISLLTEGWDTILFSLKTANTVAWISVLWQSIGNTLLGFGVWFWLIKKYNTATIAPLSLLVPIFGMLSSFILLNETLTLIEMLAACMIMIGLSMNIYFVQRKTVITHAQITR